MQKKRIQTYLSNSSPKKPSQSQAAVQKTFRDHPGQPLPSGIDRSSVTCCTCFCEAFTRRKTSEAEARVLRYLTKKGVWFTWFNMMYLTLQFYHYSLDFLRRWNWTPGGLKAATKLLLHQSGCQLLICLHLLPTASECLLQLGWLATMCSCEQALNDLETTQDMFESCHVYV